MPAVNYAIYTHEFHIIEITEDKSFVYLKANEDKQKIALLNPSAATIERSRAYAIQAIEKEMDLLKELRSELKNKMTYGTHERRLLKWY